MELVGFRWEGWWNVDDRVRGTWMIEFVMMYRVADNRGEGVRDKRGEGTCCLWLQNKTFSFFLCTRSPDQITKQVHDSVLWFDLWSTCTGWQRLIGSPKLQIVSTKEQLNICHFCGKWPIKMRDSMGLRHPVPSTCTHLHTYTYTHTHIHTQISSPNKYKKANLNRYTRTPWT